MDLEELVDPTSRRGNPIWQFCEESAAWNLIYPAR